MKIEVSVTITVTNDDGTHTVTHQDHTDVGNPRYALSGATKLLTRAANHVTNSIDAHLPTRQITGCCGSEIGHFPTCPTRTS